MSSGAYLLLVPAAMIAAPVAAVAGTAFVVAGAIVTAKDTADRIRAINAEEERELAGIAAVRNRVDSFVAEVTGEINGVAAMLQQALTGPDRHMDTTAVLHLDGVAALDRSHMDTGFSDDELFFTEFDTASGRIVYVAIDFSEVLSVSNARNSTDYRKMQIASEYTKRLMRLCVFGEQQKAVAEFINLMNLLLDDKSVGVETFERMLAERFAYLERDCTPDEELDAGAWAAYCAVCAIRHEQPRRVYNNAQLAEALNEAMQAEVTDRYRAGAAQALLESLRELGLEVSGEAELEQLQGQLFSEPGNADYAMFLGTSGDSFVLEMTQTGAPGPEAAEHKASMCAKRKQLVELMLERGYIIRTVAENDDPDVEGVAESIRTPQSAKKTDDAAERMRKRRAVAGKKGKSRAIGGA